MKKSFDPTYLGHKVNACPIKGHALYVEILDGMYRQLQNLMTHHSRIQVIRFDIRLPPKKTYDAKSENQQIRSFFKTLKENLRLVRWGSHKRIAHGWVREVGKSGHGHYHAFIAFKRFTLRLGAISGGRCTGIWDLIKRCADRAIGGSTELSLRVHTLESNDTLAFNDCIYHLSYLAKVRTKVFGTGNGHKGFDFSRIPRKAKAQTAA